MKAYVHIRNCAQMFRAPSFMMGKKWKAPKCAKVDEWVAKCGGSKQWNVVQLYKGVKC